jgi:hypothetical protein
MRLCLARGGVARQMRQVRKPLLERPKITEEIGVQRRRPGMMGLRAGQTEIRTDSPRSRKAARDRDKVDRACEDSNGKVGGT